MEIAIALIGLGGVALGGLIGGAATALVKAGELRKADENWVREQRLEVYKRFRTVWDSDLDTLWNVNVLGLEPPPEDFLVPLHNLADEVAYVGPRKVGVEAKTAADRLLKYMNATRAEEEKLRVAAEAARSAVGTSMRHALGFSSFGESSRRRLL